MNLLKTLIDLFIPRTCHVCGAKLLDCERFICMQCLDKLPLTRYDAYWHPADPTVPNANLNPMETRFAAQVPMGHAFAPFFYSRDSDVARIVHDFKYRGFSKLAFEMGKIGVDKTLHTGFFTGIDIILPVPIHFSKKFKRGYNQSEEIASGVSAVVGIPLGRNLYARRPHRTQTALSAVRRHENTKDVFAVRKAEQLDGKHILLIDDICTTGATLLAAGNAILKTSRGVRLSFLTLGVVV